MEEVKLLVIDRFVVRLSTQMRIRVRMTANMKSTQPKAAHEVTITCNRSKSFSLPNVADA
jgi:hypothetical protein